MEKEQRNRLQKATQDARKLLEEEFRGQLLQTYDIDVDRVRWAEEPGAHLQPEQRLIRQKLVALIEHKEAQIHDRKEALLLALREMAFTALNRFVALKLMEGRELVRLCVSGGLESAGFLEFTAVAQGLLANQESSYRLYLETVFEDVSRELRALFDPRDPASLIWPKRAALLELLDILNRPELAELWIEDETLGWVYQYFNGDAERKKMREESSAPRNSRELAVRNQFFTPRYVVEFLTDNTLGRIWYEMRQGNTGLKDRCRYLVRRPNEIWLQPGEEPPGQADADEGLNQEKLLRQPVYIPHRSMKDPREIRMLDPACGSMHFGLYAFDLYLEIYKEAWEIAQGSDGQSTQEETFSAFVAYAAGFADKSAFLREVPMLILQHNIHGIDIDPRATQIARLTLWLRAQRAWQEQHLQVAARPPVTRSNVVCAEPMPGERELLADFVDEQFPEAERGLIQQLLEAIFDKMQLAGEAGSLLKIEEEIRDAIDQARREWRRLAVQQRDLFSAAELAALGQAGSSLSTDLQNLTKSFWVNVEDRIYAALRDYAAQAETSSGFQRRLFADDASQGFAFIDVCRQRYDVALMNPPFGRATDVVFSRTREIFPDSYIDLYACFVERCISMSRGGYAGAITSRSFLSAVTLEKFRSLILDDLAILLDLGPGILDNAMVETAASLYGSPGPKGDLIALDSKEQQDKQLFCLKSCSLIAASALDANCHIRRKEVFRTSFKQQILYSVLSTSSNQASKALDPGVATVRAGLNTFDNFRFLRCWWEAPKSELGKSKHWEFFSKGGEYETFYDDLHLVINRLADGKELAAVNINHNGQVAQSRQSHTRYYKPGFLYTIRSSGFHVRHFPSECVFSIKGPVIQPVDDTPLGLLGIFLNSEPVRETVQRQSNANQYMPSIVKSLPWPNLPEAVQEELSSLGNSCIKGKHAFYVLLEENINFVGFLRQDEADSSISVICKGRSERVSRLNDYIRGASATASEKIASYCDSYSFTSTSQVSPQQSDHDLAIGADICDQLEFAKRFLSFLFGTAIGRWGHEMMHACDKRLRHPFAAPSNCLEESQVQVSNFEKPFLVADKLGPNEFEDCMYENLGSMSRSLEISMLEDALSILSCNRIYEWFNNPSNFFADHLKRYSRSRRQSPIYWQISSPSGQYSIFLYYHSLTPDTLFRLLREQVEPRFEACTRELLATQPAVSSSDEYGEAFASLSSFIKDIEFLKKELALVAPLWNPNLNDGVIINHSILWRITPYTPWQKKCKECWDKLVKGDYDWAHLAFHLWPERVIPNCTTDRSLAIAHGLEERLWQETNNGNWLPRQLSEADLQALVAEHSNPAVKSALERFLAAPPPSAPTRTGASRSTRSSGSSTPRRARGSAAVVDAEATRQVLLALTAAPSDGLAKTQIADLIGVEANALTAVIKQLKENGQIDQLGERRGARYVLSEQGRAAVEQEEES